MKEYKHIAGLLKALAHPARFRILEVLVAEGACCPCHLEVRLGRGQAYISQQLSRLRDAGLVDDQRDGGYVFYEISDRTIELFLSATRDLQNALSMSSGSGTPVGFLPENVQQECQCPKCEKRPH